MSAAKNALAVVLAVIKKNTAFKDAEIKKIESRFARQKRASIKQLIAYYSQEGVFVDPSELVGVLNATDVCKVLEGVAESRKLKCSEVMHETVLMGLERQRGKKKYQFPLEVKPESGDEYLKFCLYSSGFSTLCNVYEEFAKYLKDEFDITMGYRSDTGLELSGYTSEKRQGLVGIKIKRGATDKELEVVAKNILKLLDCGYEGFVKVEQNNLDMMDHILICSPEDQMVIDNDVAIVQRGRFDQVMFEPKGVSLRDRLGEILQCVRSNMYYDSDNFF